MDAEKDWAPSASGNIVPCAVCGEPVPFIDTLAQKTQRHKVCRSLACRHLLQQEAAMPPALFKAQRDFLRQRIMDQHAREAARQEHRARVKQVEAAENQVITQEYLARYPSPDRLKVVVLPSGLSQTEAQTQARRERYRDHLQSVIAAALDAEKLTDLPHDQHYDAYDKRKRTDSMLAAHPRLARICDHLCTQCRGGCCAQGADHAYVSAVSIRRRLELDPTLTAGDILDAYLDRLPEQSVAGACINQTSTGCALPRELRSDICNGYFCTELKDLQQAWDTQGEQPEQLLVIQRANTNWNRFESEGPNTVVAVTWVDEEGVRAAGELKGGVAPSDH